MMCYFTCYLFKVYFIILYHMKQCFYIYLQYNM
jgi:hypothetical protein